MEDGRRESGQVVLSGTELFCLPRVRESLRVQLGVAKHFLQGGVIQGAVSGGVEGVLKGGESGFGQWGWVGGGTGWGGGATWSGRGGCGGVTSYREAFRWDRWGCGASRRGRGCHTM